MSQVNTHYIKLQAQGRLVIPAPVRADLGVKEGDEVILTRDETGYRLSSRSVLAKSLIGILDIQEEVSVDAEEALPESADIPSADTPQDGEQC